MTAAESTEKERSVGVIFVTDHIMKGDVAVLVRRSKYNHEKLMGPQKWPGICQVTTHGGADDREYLGNTLLRECKEELGPYAEKILHDAKATEGALIKLTEVQNKKKEVITYGLRVPSYLFSKLQLTASSAGIELVNKEEAEQIVDATQKYDEKDGVADLNVIAMFPDEIEAVQKALRML